MESTQVRPDAGEALDECLARMRSHRDQADFAAARELGARLAERPLTAEAAERLAVERALALYKDPALPDWSKLEPSAALLADFLSTTKRPETCGVAAAIEKRRFELELRREHLTRALRWLEHGHACDRANGWRDQGYPGINAAFTLDRLAAFDGACPESDALLQLARTLRQELLGCAEQIAADGAYFALVTVAEAAFGLEEYQTARLWLARAATLNVPGWQLETTGRQLGALLRIHHPAGVPADALEALAALLGSSGAHAVSAAVRGKLGLALSGGGFRASFFHIGVLARLADLDLLRHVEVLSCVSGGSAVGALYHLELQSLLKGTRDGELSPEDFTALVTSLAERFQSAVALNLRTRVLFDPAENAAMLLGTKSRTVRIGELFERYLYAQVGNEPSRTTPRFMPELAIVPLGRDAFDPRCDNWSRAHKVPTLVLNASSLNTGHAFQFTSHAMGEPMGRGELDVDVNDRFAKRPYDRFPPNQPPVRLGTAVAASVCVPALFEPLELGEAYASHVVRLVDGGLHDNQGVAALLEEECTALIVSDATAQLSLSVEPSSDALSVAARSTAVLQARVREAQYAELRSRERGRLLRAFSYLHLKRGFTPRTVEPHATAPASAPSQLPYPVHPEIQARLAALRTDLDAFSELEAELLMTSGYLMAETFVRREDFDFSEPRSLVTPRGYPFLRALPLAAGTTDQHAEVLRQLEIGQLTFGKSVRASQWLRGLGLSVIAISIGALALFVCLQPNEPLILVTRSGLALTLAMLVVAHVLPRAGTLIDVWTNARSSTWLPMRIGLGFIAAPHALRSGSRRAPFSRRDALRNCKAWPRASSKQPWTQSEPSLVTTFAECSRKPSARP